MIRPEARLPNRERAVHERLGLGETVRVLKKHCEIVEVSRHLGMIRAVALFVNRQHSATSEEFGLRETVRRPKQPG